MWNKERKYDHRHRTRGSHKIYALIKTRNGARPKKVEEAFQSFAPLDWDEGRNDVGLGLDLELELVVLIPFEPFEPLPPEPLSFELSPFELLSSELLPFESLPESPLLSSPLPVSVLVGFGVVKVGVGFLVIVLVLVLVEPRMHWEPPLLGQVYPAAVTRKGRPWE